MFPLGTHRAKAVASALGMTGTGKEQVAITFQHAEQPERITWYGYFTDATFERTIESLRSLGWQGDDIYEFVRLPADCDQEVEIVVEDERDQNDNKVRKVRWINSGAGVAVKNVLDEQQARAFSASLKSRIAALRAKVTQNARPASKPQQAVPAGHPADDDIPF